MEFSGGRNGNLGTRAWGSLGPLAIFLRRRVGFAIQAAKAPQEPGSSLRALFFGPARRTNGECCGILTGLMTVRTCEVSYKDHRGVRHGVEVQAETLFEAAVMAIAHLKADPWLEKIGPATVLDIEVREPGTKHALTLQQVERWLDGATTNPNEAVRKARLKMMMVKR